MNRHLQRADAALRQCAEPLTPAQLTARPPGKWTIGEIIEHLALTYSGTVAGAERVLASGRPSARRADLRNRLRVFIVIECGYLPTGVDAPKMVVPVGIEAATALAVATSNLKRMDAALDLAAAKFGTTVKLMDHPIMGPLSVRQWRRLHWIHTRHHVRQILARTARADRAAFSG